jgi:hypothetical protein
MLTDKFFFLAQRDVVLPSQYWETLKRQDCLEPERKLMLAILEDAVWTYFRYFGLRNPLFFEVDEWFRERGSDRLYSFENICEFLGLSPSRIREALLKHTTKDEARRLHTHLGSKLKNIKRQRAFGSNIWSHTVKHRPAGILRTGVT